MTEIVSTRPAPTAAIVIGYDGRHPRVESETRAGSRNPPVLRRIGERLTGRRWPPGLVMDAT